jgi:hypothetical protein
MGLWQPSSEWKPNLGHRRKGRKGHCGPLEIHNLQTDQKMGIPGIQTLQRALFHEAWDPRKDESDLEGS